MKKIIYLFVLCAVLIPGTSFALTLSSSLGTVKNYCGAYASVIKTGNTYEIFSNEIPNTKANCPGTGCPGLVKYSGSITNPSYNGVVAPNSLINDVFNSNGTLAQNRMFSRPVVVRDGLGYAAVAMVMNGYPPPDGQGVPAFLTSPDGINWTYHGKFKGEPFGRPIFGSGMALVVNETSSPRYMFYTDGYGVGMAGLTSDGNNQWTFMKNSVGGVAELKPSQWTGYTFSSMAKLNGIYYMASSNGWPVSGWQFGHSVDGINWVHDLSKSVRSVEKNISLYVDGVNLRGLATSGLSGSSCYRKTILGITVP
jgi:hypothetical protein